MKILIKDQLDRQLLEDGYVIVPFLEATQVEHLRTLFASLHPDPIQGFYASAHVPDPAFRNHISDELRKVISPLVEQHFTDCLALGGTFIAKAAGDDGVLQPHQDWNIVDEEQHRSFNIWVPLVDVAKENGAVEILPGSHRKLPTFRGANLPNAFDEVRSLVWSAMEVLEMKAGQALIYDHRLVHGSGPNQSEALRLAVVFGVIQRQAPMRYYYQQDGRVNEYACSPSFYLEGSPGAGPADLELLRQLEYPTPILDELTFRTSFLGEAPNQNWWVQRMKFIPTILINLGVFAILFLMLELCLRVAGNKPGVLENSLYPIDTLIYRPRFKADAEGTGITIFDKDGGNLPEGYLINEQGFRSPFNFDSLTIDSLGRRAGKKVVLLVGDSYTEGCCAYPISQSYPDLLFADDDFILLNFGVGGTDLLQYKLVLDKYIREIKPDLVVVGFYFGNDLYFHERPVTPNIPLIYTIDNYAWLNSTGPWYFMGEYSKPYLESPQEAYGFYLDNFTLWGENATTFEKIIRPTVSLSRIYLEIREKSGHIELTKNNPDAIPDKTLTNTLLKEMKSTTESNGVTFIVLGIPSPKEVIAQLDMEEAYHVHFIGTDYFFPDLGQFSRDDYDGVETSNHFNNFGHRKYYEFAKRTILRVLENL